MTDKTVKKSRMGESPLNIGLLESTLDQKSSQPEHPADALESHPEQTNEISVGQKQIVFGGELKTVEEKVNSPVVVKTSKPKIPASAKKPKSENKEGKGKSEEDVLPENPFGYNLASNWPLVGYEKPFLIPIPEMQGKAAAAALSIRIPYDLNLTIERHCVSLGVTNFSEWIREALQRQLSVEQQHLSKKKKS